LAIHFTAKASIEFEDAQYVNDNEQQQLQGLHYRKAVADSPDIAFGTRWRRIG
jgi:hypothetical protein